MPYDEKRLSFKEYQAGAQETAIYPIKYAIVYPALGLCGEAGEVAGKIKKWLRDDDNQKMTEARRLGLKEELGDVLWYIAVLAADLGLCLEEIAQLNLEKLSSRKTRGTLKGDGDNR